MKSYIAKKKMRKILHELLYTVCELVSFYKMKSFDLHI